MHERNSEGEKQTTQMQLPPKKNTHWKLTTANHQHRVHCPTKKMATTAQTRNILTSEQVQLQWFENKLIIFVVCIFFNRVHIFLNPQNFAILVNSIKHHHKPLSSWRAFATMPGSIWEQPLLFQNLRG